MSEINNLAQQAFNTAIIRGKTSKDLSHDENFFGILEELREFRVARGVPASLRYQYTNNADNHKTIASEAVLYARALVEELKKDVNV